MPSRITPYVPPLAKNMSKTTTVDQKANESRNSKLCQKNTQLNAAFTYDLADKTINRVAQLDQLKSANDVR